MKNGTLIIIRLNAAEAAMLRTPGQLMPVMPEDIPFVLQRFGRKKKQGRRQVGKTVISSV